MRFESFDSHEDMFEAIRKNNEKGAKWYDEMPQIIKDALVPGCKYVMDPCEGFLVFGEIIKSEYEEDEERLATQPYLRLVKATSCVMVGDYDLGTEFASGMYPISNELYEIFEKIAWRTELTDDEFCTIFSVEFTNTMTENPAHVPGYRKIVRYVQGKK